MKYVTLLLMFLSAFAVAQEEKAETPKIGIRLDLGEIITTEELAIEFMEVMEDSRCPTDVVCVWAGRAVVKLGVSADGVTSEEVEVIVGKANENLIAEISGFKFYASVLVPHPTTKNMGNRDYKLIVTKEKL